MKFNESKVSPTAWRRISPSSSQGEEMRRRKPTGEGESAEEGLEDWAITQRGSNYAY